jgi:hypothetical protein
LPSVRQQVCGLLSALRPVRDRPGRGAEQNETWRSIGR